MTDAPLATITSQSDSGESHDIAEPITTRRMIRLVPPSTPKQLHYYIRAVFGFNIPRRPIVEGNQAPFDYVRHAFFEEDSASTGRDCIVWANRGGGKTPKTGITGKNTAAKSRGLTMNRVVALYDLN